MRRRHWHCCCLSCPGILFLFLAIAPAELVWASNKQREIESSGEGRETRRRSYRAVVASIMDHETRTISFPTGDRRLAAAGLRLTTTTAAAAEAAPPPPPSAASRRRYLSYLFGRRQRADGAAPTAGLSATAPVAPAPTSPPMDTGDIAARRRRRRPLLWNIPMKCFSSSQSACRRC